MPPRLDDSRQARLRQAGISRNEIIAAFAVFFIVVAVTVPYLQHRARAANRTAALQNLRQWGIALNLYLVENDNTLPAVGTGPADPAAWQNTLPVYLSLKPLAGQSTQAILDAGIWTDPSVPVKPSGPPESAVTYGINAWLQPDPASPPYRIYEVEDPTATFFLVSAPPGHLSVLPGGMAYRHGGKSGSPQARGQALFCDGHVEEVDPASGNRPEAAKPDANPPARPTWIPLFNARPPQ
ncbi:MAG: hypothetical protein SFU85_04070 [Candidatus Methylacidiphilales bacterium]|nr:hypothetical protein [Candidatus Methylacidiphilales bacterium]